MLFSQMLCLASFCVLPCVPLSQSFKASPRMPHNRMCTVLCLFSLPPIGQVKLADFGLSATVAAYKEERRKSRIGNMASKGKSTRHTHIAGSPLWMAPEVVQGHTATSRSDVWSLGITAIELSEGDPPYGDQPLNVVLKNIVTKPAPRLSPTPDRSALFCDFIAQCLVKDHMQRPDAAELLTHPFIAQAVNADSKCMMSFIAEAQFRRKPPKNVPAGGTGTGGAATPQGKSPQPESPPPARAPPPPPAPKRSPKGADQVDPSKLDLMGALHMSRLSDGQGQQQAQQMGQV